MIRWKRIQIAETLCINWKCIPTIARLPLRFPTEFVEQTWRPYGIHVCDKARWIRSRPAAMSGIIITCISKRRFTFQIFWRVLVDVWYLVSERVLVEHFPWSCPPILSVGNKMLQKAAIIYPLWVSPIQYKDDAGLSPIHIYNSNSNIAMYTGRWHSGHPFFFAASRSGTTQSHSCKGEKVNKSIHKGRSEFEWASIRFIHIAHQPCPYPAQ